MTQVPLRGGSEGEKPYLPRTRDTVLDTGIIRDFQDIGTTQAAESAWGYEGEILS